MRRVQPTGGTGRSSACNQCVRLERRTRLEDELDAAGGLDREVWRMQSVCRVERLRQGIGYSRHVGQAGLSDAASAWHCRGGRRQCTRWVQQAGGTGRSGRWTR